MTVLLLHSHPVWKSPTWRLIIVFGGAGDSWLVESDHITLDFHDLGKSRLVNRPVGLANWFRYLLSLASPHQRRSEQRGALASGRSGWTKQHGISDE